MNILIAEDEENIRELIIDYLANENYTIYSASNGMEALKIFKENKIDLVVLDVIMPYLDGFNLLREIRKTSNIPAIFFTARGEEMDRILGLGIGADDYIVKPFSFGELKARIEAQLRRNYFYKSGKQEENNILVSKDIKIIKDECSVYKNNKKLDLSTKEYLILLLLIENKGKVFTKKQIYDSVWENEFLFDDNTVMVHLSHLRNKLNGDKSSDQYITTIRGIGYKWKKDKED